MMPINTTKVSRSRLNDSRNRPYGKIGYFQAYCDCVSSCDTCDRFVRALCKLRRKIESIQTKRILHICKEES